MGFINCRLQKTPYLLPGHAREATGFPTDCPFEPVFGISTARVVGAGNNGSNDLQQICLYAFRPAGIVQILLRADSGLSGNAITGAIASPNLAAFVGNDGGGGARSCIISLLIPETPGIYTPTANATFTNGADNFIWQSGGYYFPNSLLGISPSLGSSLLPGILTDTSGGGIRSITGWGGTRWADGNLHVGQAVRANCPYRGVNYTLNRTTGDPVLRWFSWLPHNGAAVVPVQKAVTMPDTPSLDPNIAGVRPFNNGFILSFTTKGAGPTGQRVELAVCDPLCQFYWLLRFTPMDALTTAMLFDGNANTTGWTFAIDKYGILWIHYSQAGYTTQVFTSFEPMGWALPNIQYIPRAAVSLPCYQTCLEVNPQI